MSKIIERVMHSQLYNFLSKNNLITEQQYGFRYNHSTVLATLKLTDTIMYERDNFPHAHRKRVAKVSKKVLT